MLIGYARTSTAGQDRALQLDALKLAGCDKVYEETASGAKRDREQLAAALEFMRDGDTLVVWKLDRLARSMRQLIETIEDLRVRKIGFRSVTEAIDTTTAAGELMFHIFGALAQFERSLIRERVNAGLAAARSRGRLGGRPPIGDEALKNAHTMIERGLTPTKAAKLAGVSRSTLYKRRIVEKARNVDINGQNVFGHGKNTELGADLVRKGSDPVAS
jgi:DNA invertase Pin-like site-specific DNA recombinase